MQSTKSFSTNFWRINPTQVARDATDSQIHLCQFVSGAGVFLSVNGNIFLVTVMAVHKLYRLDEHSAGTTARVINFALIRLNHFRQQVNHTLRRIELTPAFTLSSREFAQVPGQ